MVSNLLHNSFHYSALPKRERSGYLSGCGTITAWIRADNFPYETAGPGGTEGTVDGPHTTEPVETDTRGLSE